MRQPPVRRMDDTVFAFEMGLLMKKYHGFALFALENLIKFGQISIEYEYARETCEEFFFIFYFLEKFMT